MSDLAATHHCDHDNGDNGCCNLIWLILLFSLCNNNDNGCGCGSDNLIWLIILASLFGNGNGNGNGCFNFGCGCGD